MFEAGQTINIHELLLGSCKIRKNGENVTKGVSPNGASLLWHVSRMQSREKKSLTDWGHLGNPMGPWMDGRASLEPGQIK